MANGKKELPIFPEMSAIPKYADLQQEEVELSGKGLTVKTVNSVEATQKYVDDYYPSSKSCVQCKHCVHDGIFEHDGFDPTHKKGIWRKGKRTICTKKLSLEAQNNKGIWYICDRERMNECHFFEPE